MNIYVGNLSLETTEDELCKMFTEFGKVISVTLLNDKYIGSGQPRAYGYVEMDSKSEGVAAIANLNMKRLWDRVIHVVEALPLTERKGAQPFDIRSNSQSNRSRRRKYQKV